MYDIQPPGIHYECIVENEGTHARIYWKDAII